MDRPRIRIDGRDIGRDYPPYLIAELSGNHGGQLANALRLIDEAKRAGADAVKIQTYRPDTITIDHRGRGFDLEDGPWAGRTLFDLYKETHTPWEWHEELFLHARSAEITLFSSPFDPTSIELLESLGAPAYKIASFEIVDIGLIKSVAETGKPVILSTGLASLQEIEAAFAAANPTGRNETALLHCISGYPSPPEEANLATIQDLSQRFDAVIGLSDHSLTHVVAVAAIASGASIIEKHLTLDRANGGPDAAFSLEPDEFQDLTRYCREAWTSLGSVDYNIKPSEQANLVLRRSLYVVEDIAAGEAFNMTNVRSIRPGLGLPPQHLEEILARNALVNIARGTPLSWDLVSDD
ncbi:MAG: hypothetical protein QOG04_981 [Actinomycetota bacterium]|jgi:N-acetylneuraminate synthase|nr:hypothetical protein [Actinomycetota bacterium]